MNVICCIDTDQDITDKALLALGRQIAPRKFYEIGGNLGFNKTELEKIEHRTVNNRKDANIQMLSEWKASQASGPKAKQTLKLVWKSLEDASKAEKTKGIIHYAIYSSSVLKCNIRKNP